MAAPDSPQVVATPGLILAGADDLAAQSQTKRALEPLLGGEAVEVAQPKMTTILGLQRRNFFVCVAVILLIVGATVGGSVGGALAVQSRTGSEPGLNAGGIQTAMSAPPVPTESVSFYVPPAPGSILAISTQCGPKLRSWNSDAYSCHAGHDIPGKGDIAAIFAYSIQQCIDACSSISTISGAPKCKAVALGMALKHEYEQNKGANCWLKNITGDNGEMSENTDYVVLTLDE